MKQDTKRQAAERFGRFLRSLRRQSGWTQVQAGEAVGVDAVTIRRWELGLFSPSSKRILQLAEAYGVGVSELIDASRIAEQDDSTAFLPIRGYLDAGSDSEGDGSSLGNIALPSYMVQAHSDDYCLRVNGDRLAPDGIHDGDVLLVCPDQAPSVGSLCVIDMDYHLCAVTYIDQGNLRVRTASGDVVGVKIAPEQMVGTVAWHVRKM